MNKVMILVIDGCGPAYLTPQTAPRLFRLARERGFAKTGQGAVPTVTNVNHACILSGEWPEVTKITGNYYYDPQTGREGFVEERGHMRAPTLLQRCKLAGGKTALLTVKGKVLGVYGEGADIALSAQSPDPGQLEHYGLDRPPPIQSAASSEWILKAAWQCLRHENPDLLYCTTNDYIFHHFAPGRAEAVGQIKAIDRYLEKIHRLDPQRQIYVTADHGMNQKTRLVNFQTIAERAGFLTYCLPPLKDRYVENHIYQEGGLLYVFLKEPAQAEAFYRFAQSHPLLEQVLSKEEAAAAYHLPLEQIGDFVLFAGQDTAFGEVEGEVLQTQASRTHGSLYEREVPLIAVNPAAGSECYRYSKDIARYLVF